MSEYIVLLVAANVLAVAGFTKVALSAKFARAAKLRSVEEAETEARNFIPWAGSDTSRIHGTLDDDLEAMSRELARCAQHGGLSDAERDEVARLVALAHTARLVHTTGVYGTPAGEEAGAQALRQVYQNCLAQAKGMDHA